MTKDTVLAILLERDGYVSGEKISRELGVSRAAVNGAIRALEKDGCHIDSVTGLGYRLLSAPDRITLGGVIRFLGASRGESIRILKSAVSTNDEIRAAAKEGAAVGSVVIAESQSGGRGRLGRHFLSPEGGIYLSYLLRPATAPADTAPLTAYAAVAVARAIEEVCGVRPGIKWVNDLILDGKKIAGILTELSVEAESGLVQSVTVGIGVNARSCREYFSPEIAAMASSLEELTGCCPDRNRLVAAIIREMDHLGEIFPGEREDYLAFYRAASVNLGKEVAVIRGGQTKTGVALAVDEQFALVIRYGDGSEEAVSGGEVSVRGLYGYV